MIRITDLTKRYGSFTAVDAINLEVPQGELFGFLGPNGAGKTTTIRLLLDLLRPSRGTASVMNIDCHRASLSARRLIGYLPGELPICPDLTAERYLSFLAKVDGRTVSQPDLEALCRRFDVSAIDLRRKLRDQSHGMKQKIGIVQAFQHRPSLVVLDEPTEGLDPVMKDRFIGLLKEHTAGGGTVFLSSHILSEVELATDRVAVLRDGRVVKVGPTRDLTGERLRHCSLTLRTAPPAGFLDMPGVRDLQGDGIRFVFDFQGDMGDLIRRLAPLDVQEFLAEPESLTEAFFDVYGEES